MRNGFYNIIYNFEKRDADKSSRTKSTSKRVSKGQISFEDLKESIETCKFKKNK